MFNRLGVMLAALAALVMMAVAGPAGADEIELDATHGAPVVGVQINGQPVRLIVDTRMPAIATINAETAGRLRLRPFMSQRMRVAVCDKYGGPEVFRIETIEVPAPKEGEVRVCVHAAPVNDWDFAMLEGRQFIIRAMSGLLRPRVPILGCDFAGRAPSR